MDLKIDDIHAFMKTFEAGSFTAAAKSLGLTQSALSQKMARIELILQTSIFIRKGRKLELTESGEKLLTYGREIIQRHQDFLCEFDQYAQELSGVIRIAGFSSVMRSVIIPKLAPFLRKNPGVKIEFSIHEMPELEDILKSHKADLILTDYYPKLNRILSHEIMQEEYVIIKSSKHEKVPMVFLDHTKDDNATETYFSAMEMKKNYKRAFMGDVYSILDGVDLGLGKAVMSKHLVEGDKRFIIESKRKKYKRPVVVSYLEQNYYGPLQLQILELLESD